MHAIWLSVFVPTIFFLVWAIPEFRYRRIWLACLGVATTALVVFVGFKVQQLPGAAEFLPQKAIFALVTSIDLPLLAIFAGSAINLVSCWILPKGPDCGCCGIQIDKRSQEPLNPTAT